MSITEVVDQVTYSFVFIVTPIQIVSTKSIKNLKKSLLLKLGDKTQKTSQMNKPIQIPLEVLYSKTLKKYCPIKGIIKVYDINSDGSEVISSVGGFQTEEILNEQKTSTIVERDIGTSKVKMKIEVKNLGIVDHHKHHRVQKQIQEVKSGFSWDNKARQSIPNLSSTKSIVFPSKVQKLSQQNENNNKRENAGSHYFKRSTNLNNSSISQTPKVIIAIKRDIIDPVTNNLPLNEFRQTISSRAALQKDNQMRQENTKFNRKENALHQQKKIDSIQDLNRLKKEIQEYKKQRAETLQHFQKFQQCFESKNNKIWVEFYEKLKTLSWKYKNKQFEKVFDDFFQFILNELEKKFINEENLQDSSSQNNQLQAKSKSRNERRTSDNLSLRAIQRQKDSLEMRLKQKQFQCLQLENRIKELQSFKKTLMNENEYMREKDETMQQIISQKQTQIQNLKQEITEIQVEFKQMQATLKNDACEIQELREEVSNLNQTIETYREKYGDLKNVKNRALENQLKECLLWIDQQTRELEMSDFEDDTEASHSHNVSDIIKNIELEGASREEMNSIKEELAGLIKRIDNFLAK